MLINLLKPVLHLILTNLFVFIKHIISNVLKNFIMFQHFIIKFFQIYLRFKAKKYNC